MLVVIHCECINMITIHFKLIINLAIKLIKVANHKKATNQFLFISIIYIDKIICPGKSESIEVLQYLMTMAYCNCCLMYKVRTIIEC